MPLARRGGGRSAGPRQPRASRSGGGEPSRQCAQIRRARAEPARRRSPVSVDGQPPGRRGRDRGRAIAAPAFPRPSAATCWNASCVSKAPARAQASASASASLPPSRACMAERCISRTMRPASRWCWRCRCAFDLPAAGGRTRAEPEPREAANSGSGIPLCLPGLNGRGHPPRTGARDRTARRVEPSLGRP